ncbi:MAG: hypothetical protein M1290_00095 [Candidatus Thermoplasmatota archaeon]|jgi:hypothetical protein|nr:hypothetical protein [Candidatus Thermoplasmatota archaeon]MCL5788853.1 hypothetical protein [Candidatus Thermoplasmatota archaeon]
MLDNDASTAKTLTLVAIILQAVFFVFGIFETLGLAVFSVSTSIASSSTVTTTVTSSVGPSTIIAIIFSAALAIGILWTLLDYFLIYKRLKEERVKEADTPAIVLGIIQLIFGGLIPGILLIVAWIKIRDSVNMQDGLSDEISEVK